MLHRDLSLALCSNLYLRVEITGMVLQSCY